MDDAHCTDAVVTSKLGIRTTYIVGLLHLNLTKKSKLALYIDRSPAFLTFDDFISSNEIIRTKWPICVVIGHFDLMISSEGKNSK